MKPTAPSYIMIDEGMKDFETTFNQGGYISGICICKLLLSCLVTRVSLSRSHLYSILQIKDFENE